MSEDFDTCLQGTNKAGCCGMVFRILTIVQSKAALNITFYESTKIPLYEII
jgi:hypothetical protein